MTIKISTPKMISVIDPSPEGVGHQLYLIPNTTAA
jgi:hypothetical protein